MADTAERDRPEFTAVITCFNEGRDIAEFLRRLTRSIESTGRDFEIVVVNDGSLDETWECVVQEFKTNPRIQVAADLFRNAGQVAAMSCGIGFARGRDFLFMDSDLQLDPEELPMLLERFDAGCDIVSGYRAERQDAWFRQLPSYFANIIMRQIAGHTLRDFGCTFKLYRGELVRAFGFGDRKPWRTGYVFAKASRVEEVPVTHRARKHGRSGWNFRKLSAFLLDHAIGLSRRPFQFLFAGCVALAALFLLRVFIGFMWDARVLDEVTPGLLLNAMVIHLLVVIALFCLIGEYLVRVFYSTQDDPIYVVRQVLSRRPEDGDSAHG